MAQRASQVGLEEEAQLQVALDELPGWDRVTVAGDLDASGASLLRRSVETLFRTGGRDVVLDVGLVTAFDARGLSCVHALGRELSARGRTLLVTGLAEPAWLRLDAAEAGSLLFPAMETSPT